MRSPRTLQGCSASCTVQYHQGMCLLAFTHIKRVSKSLRESASASHGKASRLSLRASASSQNYSVLGLMVDQKLSRSQQWVLTAQKAKGILSCMARRSKEVILPHYSALVTPHWQRCIHFWCPSTRTWKCCSKSRGLELQPLLLSQHKKDMEVLQCDGGHRGL